MNLKYFELDKDEFLNKVTELLQNKSEEKYVVLGRIDNIVFDFVYTKKASFSKLYLGVSKKYTTKNMIDKISNLSNVYICNNDEYRNMIIDNLVITKEKNTIVITIIPFEIRNEIIENSKNKMIEIELNEKDLTNDIKTLIECYVENKNNYQTLDSDVIKELENKKAFRNEKADTLTKEISRDEIIKSFRSSQNFENKDEFLKMIEVNSKIKNSTLLQDEVQYLDYKNEEESISKKDIEFDDDIKFDLGE